MHLEARLDQVQWVQRRRREAAGQRAGQQVVRQRRPRFRLRHRRAATAGWR